MRPKAIENWLALAAARNYAALNDLLAEDVLFRSPVVHRPQAGRAISAKYLRTALSILGGAGFRYVQMWFSERSAVLEFEAELEGIFLNGVDIIHWNEQDKIISFKVMVRPLKAINLLRERMAAALQTAD
jgi:hypothetical protein